MTDYFIIYEHKNFEGKQYRVELEGKLNGELYSLKGTVVHDKMSSVKWRLSDSKKVVFYQHSNAAGAQYTITGNGDDPDTHTRNFGDCASSWRLIDGDSIPLAFSKIDVTPSVLTFTTAGIAPPTGGHLQGVQRLDHRHLVISGSSKYFAYFIIVRWPDNIRADETGKVIKLVKINDDFPGMKHNHAGGIQICGHVLAVGTENRSAALKSSVVFYDLSEVDRPKAICNAGGVPYRIDRKWKTAGAVGLVRRHADVLLAVGGWNSNNIDFYISADPTFENVRFEKCNWWKKYFKDTCGWIDKNWGQYQSLNIAGSDNGGLFLAGFNRNKKGRDWVDLYFLDLNANRSRILKKIDKKRVYCRGGASFQHGSGLCAPDPVTNMSLMAVERTLQDSTTVNIWGNVDKEQLLSRA